MKLALKYNPRPKIAEGFIQRRLDTRIDERLSAQLEAREAEGVWFGHCSRRMSLCLSQPKRKPVFSLSRLNLLKTAYCLCR